MNVGFATGRTKQRTMKSRISIAQQVAGVVRGAGSERLPAFQETFIPIFALTCALLVLTGCGAFESRTQRLTLSDSGFLARLPETERQRDFYAALPPYKLYAGVENGQPFYVYKTRRRVSFTSEMSRTTSGTW